MTEPVNIVEARKAVIFDGSNGAGVVDVLNAHASARGPWTLVSESPTELIVDGPGLGGGTGEYTLGAGGVFLFWQGSVDNYLSAEAFNYVYRID